MPYKVPTEAPDLPEAPVWTVGAVLQPPPVVCASPGGIPACRFWPITSVAGPNLTQCRGSQGHPPGKTKVGTHALCSVG